MNKQTFFLIALYVLVAAGFAFLASRLPDEGTEPSTGELLLQTKLPEIGADLEALRQGQERVEEGMHALAGRIEAVEAAAARRPVEGLPGEARTAEAPTRKTPPPKEATPGEFASLLSKVLRLDPAGSASEEEQARFWELARKTDLLKELIAGLEAGIEGNPQDLERRMSLAGAYVAKLLSVPDGPERGLWAMKAEQQWRKVLETDPGHWEAQYSLAFSWGQWPDFLNKTGEAIQAFERARKIQERRAPEDRYAVTYLELSRLYLKQGKKKEALEALEKGRALFPRNKEILKRLKELR